MLKTYKWYFVVLLIYMVGVKMLYMKWLQYHWEPSAFLPSLISTIYPWVFLLAHLSWKSFLITSCTNVHLSLSSSHFQLLPETLDWFQPNLAKSIFEWIAFKFIQMQHQAFQREDWLFWKSFLSRTKQLMIIELLCMLPKYLGS